LAVLFEMPHAVSGPGVSDPIFASWLAITLPLILVTQHSYQLNSCYVQPVSRD
jgi:hypothetical protein